MDHFNYNNNLLHAEAVPLTKIADSVGTPFYCYSTATLERHYNVLAEVFKNIKSTICFAVKACPNIAVIRTLSNLGAGADTVSEGEIRRALAANVPANKIVFSGVGKTPAEIEFALKKGIMQFNVESEPELLTINSIAKKLGKKAPISFRVNPDVDAGTHDKISTGRKEDKFGIAWESAKDIYKLASTFPNIEIVGLSTHIGSQLTKLDPFRSAFRKMVGLAEELKSLGFSIKRIDLGGGLGVPYTTEDPPAPKEYAELIVETIKNLGCELLLEPGRVIAGNAGILVCKVIYVKKTAHKNFVIVDAAMNDLMRPALYDAKHEIVPINQANELSFAADIVGPVCETGDVLARNRDLPELEPGDLIAFRTAGAYGASMSNSYNSRLLVPEVLVKGSEFSVIRNRQTYEEMLLAEKIPNWF